MPLPFQRRGGAHLRPTLSRDFAGLKTLDHGVGPAIRFERSPNGTATYFDANGVLQTVGNDVPRFDHDPASGNASRGLLIEESRTNSIRNSQAGGAVNGVIGSATVPAPALPTNWGQSGTSVNAIDVEIIGTGTEDGLAYVDVKFSGTPTATSSVFVTFDTATQIVAANGQTWTGSSYSKLVGGNLTNVTQTRAFTSGRTAAGASIAGQIQSTNFTPDSTALKLQRRTATFTFTDATVERVQNGVAFSYTSGQPIDLTLRIAAPQLEQGAFPTSYIPTTTAAATRSADSAVVTPISSFYNQAEGTLFAEGLPVVSSVGTTRHLLSIGNSSTEYLSLLREETFGSARGWCVISPNVVANLGSTAFTATGKLALAYKQDDFAFSFNGGTVATDTSGNLPTADRMRIGSRSDAGANANGHIRKIAYWPKRLSNTLLQQLTT